MLDLVAKQHAELTQQSKKLQNEKSKLEQLIKGYEDSGRKEEAESIFVNNVVDATKSMGTTIKRDKIRFGGRITATGSALPVSVIAHTFSYLKLKSSNSVFMANSPNLWARGAYMYSVSPAILCCLLLCSEERVRIL